MTHSKLDIDSILAQYITRETHKGSVNRVRILAKLDLEQLIREQRLIELDLLEQAINQGRDMNKYKMMRLEALTDSHKED